MGKGWSERERERNLEHPPAEAAKITGHLPTAEKKKEKKEITHTILLLYQTNC